jgi:ACS family D-galactonate transporter-like MFS transporter
MAGRPSAHVTIAAKPDPSLVEGLWRRQIDRYPDNGRRALYLGIVVLASITLYYELYIQGAVATNIINQYGMTFRFFVFIAVVGNLVGAFASLAAGLADRWGRANLVAYGLLLTAVLILFALPNASSKWEYAVFFYLVSMVEGVVLVATPALIRDFSPQLGRAQAMGFWTLGPVIGSLVVTEVSSHTLASHPDWQFQFRLCGVVGAVVFVVAWLGLRELSPRIRDQLMVSMHDKALIEARAAGIDTEAALEGHWGQMIRPSIVGPAFAISVFLLFYYILVGFIVVYFATNFGYTPARANSLANWYWISNALALVVAGVLSDKLRVRKPFMVIGAAVSAVAVALFAIKATDPTTSYYTFAVLFIFISVGSGLAYCAWMAAFTETVEKANPAATATGLAVWGWTIRMIVTLSLIGLTIAVSAANVLVDFGQQALAIQAKYPLEVATLQKLSPATAAALNANPNDTTAQYAAVGELSGVPASDVATLAKAQVTYSRQIATLQKLTPATQAALNANPNDTTAQYAAVNELSGVPVSDVATLAAALAKYPTQIATLQAIDPATQAALLKNAGNLTALGKAQSEIAAHFGISTKAALTRLIAAAAIPKPTLVLLGKDGPEVLAAETQLLAVKAIPSSTLHLLATDGTKVLKAKTALLQVSIVPKADLSYLAAHGADIQRAQKNSPHQWQRWWWICFAGQLVFVPFIWLLKGRWSPAKAKEDERQHAADVEREMKAMLESGALAQKP